MKDKIEMVIKNGLTYVKCTRCGTEDSFKTFDETDNFKTQTLAGDWETGLKQNITCNTCKKTTPFYDWRTVEYFYE